MDFVRLCLTSRRFSTFFTELNELKFFIHDEEHTVKVTDIGPEATLNSYLRQWAYLTGTKSMCLEGGCGVCIVAATIVDPLTKREVVLAVNSCLVPIYSCAGWRIHTAETLARSIAEPHPVQKVLVQYNGTQCGFCSPGMMMTMYALYKSGNFTMKDVENSFGGNICRCTGYRSIMTAFKSLAPDASSDMGAYPDIEDIYSCSQKQGKCKEKCASPCIKEPHYYDFGTSRWVKVFSINEILNVIREFSNAQYMLVGGNTAMGVYKRTREPNIYIDITGVTQLLDHTIHKRSLIVGANMSLTNAKDLFYMLAKEHERFSYLKKLADHIDLIAHVAVRNTGTLAGNLFIKHEHQEFPSDIFLILETVGATLTIVGTDHREVNMNLVDFLSFDMKGKIIKNIILPVLDQTYRYDSYKITPRAQNAHAHLNAGFLLKLNSRNKVKLARIVYGAISPSFTHAVNAEKYLVGKNLFDDNTLQGVFQTLEAELHPDHVLPDPSPEFRRKLAIALFYKFILSIAPRHKISSRKRTTGSTSIRPLSFGSQDFETKEFLYPLTQPIPKIEALAQCSGKAKYIMDMPDMPGQLYAAFVLAKAPAHSVVVKTDPSAALVLDGVKAYYDKNDIPGENNFMPAEAAQSTFTVIEEIFCSGVVKYYFQPVGLIVAKSQELADKGADLVKIQYIAGKQKPLLTIRDILDANAKDKIFTEGKIEATNRGSHVQHVIKGKFDISWQYHYQMETQCCVVVPVEDGLDMHPSTQTMNLAQVAAAKALNISANKINVSVRRLGGAYGSKASRNSLVSCAAAIAAYKLQKPIKLSLPFSTNMNVIGKRCPFSADYEVGVDAKACIQYLNASLYTDLGSSGGNENKALEILDAFGRGYKTDTWNVTIYSTRTDTPTGTWCRAPATNEAISSVEAIMEHIGSILKIDPVKVRLKNTDDKNFKMEKYLTKLVQWAEVEKRKNEVEKFNKASRWVKKGIAVVGMVYPMILNGYWNAIVSIYEGDGSVAIAHGGIEFGQGINTKAAQMCAYALDVPLDKVSVKPSSVLVSPNAVSTSGSKTSESICYAILKACDILKKRMKPIKDKMKNPTWAELIRQCYLENVDLSATFLYNATLSEADKYSVYGATCAEVEVDILTGLHQVTRVDILEDVGSSLSPQIDIGQVEGAFIMGMGYWTSEKIIFSEQGELLTNRTWNYKPPGVKDIPIDFRVRFPKNNPNKMGILRSKAVGEPPLCMACSVPFAIKKAAEAARVEANPEADSWYPIDGPSTVENMFLNSLHDYTQYTL